MTGAVAFRDMLAGDVVQLALQPSQHRWLGLTRPVTSFEEGQELASGGPAWTAVANGGRILTCAGFKILWPENERTKGHAIAWALLAADLGTAHLAITRFARARIAEAPYARLEAIVRAGNEAERTWAWLVGFRNPTLLRAWGPDAEDHLLYERTM
jgi:hypothetical protein